MTAPRKSVLTVAIIWGHNQGDNSPILRSWMQITASKCLNCHHKLNAASVPGEENLIPRPCDYTVCIYCGHLMAFCEDLSVRSLTDEEIIAVAGNKELLKVTAFCEAFRRWKEDEQKKNR